METKICNVCKKEKEVTEFNKSKKQKDGLQWKCKECQSSYAKLYVTNGRNISRIRKNTLKNQCTYCKNTRISTSKYCLYHFVRSIVTDWKLPKEKVEETVTGLILKLERTEYCCHYSGLKITPGFSASIDHRIPQSKGGTHDLTNLVWCHSQVNKIKSDLSEKEFINRSASILVELNYLDSKGQL